jgi:pyridoxamine 5'-phosphate oxidase
MKPSLEDVLASAFACLAEGAEDPASAWHTPTLANVDSTGFASQRSVVLRHWDAAARTLDIHTDTRSAKYEAFLHDPKASLHGWHPESRIQLRLRGFVQLHVGDDTAKAAWGGLRPATRATYGVLPGPGTIVQHAQDTSQAEESAGLAVFCVIRMAVCELEWLQLEQGSQARARFRWDNGTCRSMWLVP